MLIVARSLRANYIYKRAAIFIIIGVSVEDCRAIARNDKGFLL